MSKLSDAIHDAVDRRADLAGRMVPLHVRLLRTQLRAIAEFAAMPDMTAEKFDAFVASLNLPAAWVSILLELRADLATTAGQNAAGVVGALGPDKPDKVTRGSREARRGQRGQP